MKDKSYKRTEKWWLGLIVLFYGLYNFPGFPAYGDSEMAIWHGALTLIPLWIISYGGMIRLNRQRKLKKASVSAVQELGHNTEANGMLKEGI
ncbi:MAG: hypothetical protein ABFC84_16995 [Veillonellales bacterium]